MSRRHFQPRSLRPRREPHQEEDGCVVVRPPTDDDDVFFGFCENLGLWRIKAPPFDAHGAIELGTGIEGFYEALAAAIDELRPQRPQLAEAFERLLPGHEE